MTPRHRIIIDTDPGVDDVLALLLALSASPEELEIVMLSVTYGNVPLQGCLRNVVALFHVLEKELSWRKSTGRPEGYGALKSFKPIVAVGAEHPLEEEELMADHFHGADGLHEVHKAHPDLTPADTWRSLFHSDADSNAAAAASSSADSEPPAFSTFFTPSKVPAHREMLRILRSEPRDTVTIIAIGPLTNVALAAAEDTEAFLRVKELVVMGGAVGVEGNITPLAEFNCYADSVAAARVFALTSPRPRGTMPPSAFAEAAAAGKEGEEEEQKKEEKDIHHPLGLYPRALSRALKLTLFPLDITTPHLLNKGYFLGRVAAPRRAGSPLARWLEHVLGRTFDKIDDMLGDGSEPGLSLHDPLCVWYMLLRGDPAWRLAPGAPEDIRVETAGQWTRGMHVVDRRARRKVGVPPGGEGETVRAEGDDDPLDGMRMDEVPGDTQGWLSHRRGNRIDRMVASPGEELFAEELMRRLFD